MFKSSKIFFTSLAVTLILVGGCTGPTSSTVGSADGPNGDRLTGAVRVDGSSTVFPITEAVAEEFAREYPKVKVTVSFSGTGGGMKKFWQREIDICNASRAIKQSERELCEEAGVDFIELSVAFDGLAVVINPENDWCDCLTVEQLKELWAPGSSIAHWSDLDPAWPEEEMSLYGPGTDSGTFDYFTKAIVGEEKASRDDYTASENDNVLVTGIQSDQHALGYFGYAYYAENEDRLKLVTVDAGDGNCVGPSTETVRSNSYKPLSRPLYIYVSKVALQRPEVARFVQYYLTSAATLAAEVGYVAVSDDVSSQNQQLLDDALAAPLASK